MAKDSAISMPVIRRLPRYYRFLYDLKENGITRISSRELSHRMGLTASQSMFLHALWYRQHKMEQPTYAKDLEAFFDIKHSTVSGILQRMETAGFLTLEASETDRRCKTIHLTAQAEAAHAQTEQHIQQTEALLTQGMTEAEAAEFRRLLQVAANNLRVCTQTHNPPVKEDFQP